MDSKNNGLRWKNEVNIRGWSDGMILPGYPHGYYIEYCVPYSLVYSILALADFRDGFAELRTWIEEWREYAWMK